NPKRAHLLVSNVLGKHVPQRPSVVYGAGFELVRASTSRRTCHPSHPLHRGALPRGSTALTSGPSQLNHSR
ncbi:phosphoribosyltransferase domain-containing protein, partial [Streptomyces sp900116325]|uniref:phosphoribosyltransferase domain-containing protein n=1 Tax=Streptomyces sp. 900116325 TaxID=3154295 RepID=UPI0033B419BB